MFLKMFTNSIGNQFKTKSNSTIIRLMGLMSSMSSMRMEIRKLGKKRVNIGITKRKI